MNSTRPTKTITVEGHTIVMKTYLTYMELEPVLEAEMSASKKTAEMAKIVLLSVDESTEDVFNKIANMPFSVYGAVAQEVATMVGGDFQTAK